VIPPHCAEFPVINGFAVEAHGNPAADGENDRRSHLERAQADLAVPAARVQLVQVVEQARRWLVRVRPTPKAHAVELVTATSWTADQACG
jgi:hypothetical protein